MDFTYDDTLPPPDEVEREFFDHAGGDVNAWFERHDIAAAPIGGKLIQYGMIWNPCTGRYRFLIYTPDHVGPKYPPELAIPIFEDGVFVDLLFISDEMTFARATCRAPWLGRENLLLEVIRLHAHPMDWLEAGCTGVCHIEPCSRKALAELTDATTIECNDIHTALEAWDWGFGGDDNELSRFVIDDTPGSKLVGFAWSSASDQIEKYNAIATQSKGTGVDARCSRNMLTTGKLDVSTASKLRHHGVLVEDSVSDVTA